ncbi:MAG: hypothetical protein IJQ07_01570 [Clostridia bacterium]|nr:hypothetical protein [Clostridia bacterium]
MNRKKVVYFLTSVIKTGLSFLVVALLCFFFGSFNRVYAANYDEEQSGITLYQNYDVTTANVGAYAGKSVDPSLFSAGSYYTALYSGGTVDITSGYMYEANKKGVTSKVRLLDEYRGTFSIFSQGFYNADISPYDYGRLAFIFTNTANTKQYIKFSFTQSASNYLAFNAYYYDLDVQETAVYKTTSDMNLMASFSATSNYMTAKKKTALKFSYNNSTQELNLANSGSVKDHNLNTLLSATLPTFSSYSVDMAFENKSQANTAKFIIYELCGQVLAGETLTDTATPIMLSVGASVADGKLTAKAYDLVDGVITNGFVFTVEDPQGQDVTNVDDSSIFHPETTGEYTITAYVLDASNRQSDVMENTITVEPDTEKPKITVDGNYRQYYLKGETLEILPFTATDESGIKESGVRAEKGSQPVEISKGTLALNSLGEYTIIYYAFDNFDNENESEFTLNVTEITVAEKIILEGDGVAQSIPQLVTPSGWNYSFTMKDKSGNDVNLENGAYVFNEVQKYTVYYSVIPESETTAKFHYQTEIEITDTTKPVITLSGEYEKEYESNYELSIISATVTDNCKDPKLTVEVLYDGLKAEIGADNKVKLDKAGKYVVRYTATDASGNSEVLSVELQVNETVTDVGSSCNSNINSGNALLLAVVLLAFAVFLRKRIKKHN